MFKYKKIASIGVIGLLLISLTGCMEDEELNEIAKGQQHTKQQQTIDKGYLKYCGEQIIYDDKGKEVGGQVVRIYEDTKHKKVLYIGLVGDNEHITIAASDLK